MTAQKKLDVAAFGHSEEGRITIMEILFLLINCFKPKSVVKVRGDGLFLSNHNAQLSISEKSGWSESSLDEFLHSSTSTVYHTGAL